MRVFRSIPLGNCAAIAIAFLCRSLRNAVARGIDVGEIVGVGFVGTGSSFFDAASVDMAVSGGV